MRRLSRELVSLIEHIELRDANWWTSAARASVEALLHEITAPIPERDLLRRLGDRFGAEFKQETVGEAVAGLLSDGSVVALQAGLTLSESERCSLSDQIRALEEEEEAFCLRLERIFAEHGIEDGASCQLFEDRLIIPMVQGLGARVYELLVGQSAEVADESITATFVEAFPEELRGSVTAACAAVLDPGDPVVRRFVLRRLNAFFLLEATRLPVETLSALFDERPTADLRIFVDTNLLFSLLDLRDHPSNEAVRALQSVLSSLGDGARATLYVLPITVKEAQQTLVNMTEGFRMSLPPSAAEAALKGEISGLSRLYYTAAAGFEGGRLDSKTFFGDYIKGLIPIIRQHGLELYNAEDLESYRVRQDVLDAALGMEEHQKATRGVAKHYEPRLHDSVLWHFVRDRRARGLDSPLTAKYWIATLDFQGLLSFDRYKHKRGSIDLPLCLNPAALVQLLQFWVPMSEGLEEALLGAFRLPLLLREFDSQSERVTIKILNRLSRYEGVEDLTVETVSEILIGEALRGRMAGAVSGDEEQSLVDWAVVSELAGKDQSLKTAEAQKAVLAEKLRENQDQMASIKRQRTEDAGRHQQALAQKDAELALAKAKPKFIAALIASATVLGPLVLAATSLLEPTVESQLNPFLRGGVAAVIAWLGLRMLRGLVERWGLRQWWLARWTVESSKNTGRAIRFLAAGVFLYLVQAPIADVVTQLFSSQG